MCFTSATSQSTGQVIPISQPPVAQLFAQGGGVSGGFRLAQENAVTQIKAARGQSTSDAANTPNKKAVAKTNVSSKSTLLTSNAGFAKKTLLGT